jgi:hypothetical protein
MASKPVTLGEYQFSSKKDAKQFYSKILNETDLDQNLSGESFDYVMALLLNHPRMEEKIGNGVEAIKVSTGYTSANRCFHVVRQNGSTEDFSIGKCIDGEHSDFHRFCLACRKAIEGDVRAYKRRFFDENSNENGMVRCQRTNQYISFEDAHADHREPFTFSVIVHFFCKTTGIDLSAVPYLTHGKYGAEFACSELKGLFQRWHKEHAVLRIVHGKTNLRKSYLGRIKNTKADGSL